MREHRQHSWIFLVCSLSVLIGACSTTSIFERKAPDLGDLSFKNIVVMGLFDSLEDRKVFESGVAKALKGKGCDASPSLSVLEGARKYSKEELAEIFSKAGFDGALIQRVTGVEEERTTIPESYYWPWEPFAYSWYGYWSDDGVGDGMGLLMRGGYNEKHDIVTVESGLFSLKTEKLVWVAHTQTTRVQTVRALASRVGPKVAKKLKKEKLIR